MVARNIYDMEREKRGNIKIRRPGSFLVLIFTDQ